MGILGRCYASDRRKARHALTYADHALQYDDRFQDSIGRGYLEQAKQWLEEQRREAPWLERIGPLLATVTRRLQSRAVADGTD
jgi:hypothetical protein